MLLWQDRLKSWYVQAAKNDILISDSVRYTNNKIYSIDCRDMWLRSGIRKSIGEIVSCWTYTSMDVRKDEVGRAEV